MRIPKKMRVGDKWYSVDVVESMRKRGDMARVFYPEQRIEIGMRSNRTGKSFAPAAINNSFWHEVVHAILHDMGRESLNRDERFVTAFADRLSKAVDTAKFE
tara:strand:- start:3312 stop:3617 length:306 start_codon:yes stop_codon:yes gene_type:complete